MDMNTFLTLARSYYLMAKRQHLFSFILTLNVNEKGKRNLPMHEESNFLTEFSHCLPKHLREYDAVCKNGDDVHVLLAGVDEKNALNIKKRIEEIIAHKMNTNTFSHMDCHMDSIYWVESQQALH